ncbi:hypothetical protein EHH44_11995 [Mycolicibacter terrae]|uniref:Transmembrane protein n=2 Tax=Mycolicibacter TaxID=1073531 RepID=A0A1A2XPM8_MYCSD|nr:MULTISPECIES: hypothetical protein [Mycolicibacter]OBH16332.1 hypothetical protein A5694_06790 [Mycolicibacter sinensis]OBI26846.1 hypothetical protein A5710_00470 [Mycolicibacter sinensis]RRR44274.1 hypothetical protein EHH44_11995 [Mycolicibacter terrae]
MSGLPTLSEVRAASWDHLRTNAAAWRNLGRTWESAFTEVHQSSLCPGGADWTGAGAEAFRDRSYLDLVKIRTPVDTADTLAGIAERGADAQDGNKSSVLDTVDGIEGDNFAVGEDWSVTDTITWYSSAAELEQREQAAEDHHRFLMSKVYKLVGDEDDIARNLATASAGLHQFSFGDEGADGWAGKNGGPPRASSDPADPAEQRDLAIVNDPDADPTARQLAQERLDDLRNAQIVGDLPIDPVLGGDTRSRAQARRQLQDFLESGQAFSDRPPLTPDQATQMVDRLEAQGRETVLRGFADQLEAAGVSPPGIQRVLDEVQSGKSPGQVIREAGAGIAGWGGALGGGAETHGAALPNGRHWGSAQVWSKADAQALEMFGRKLGYAGIGLDTLLTFDNIAHGAPKSEEIAKLGGRTLGGIAGGFAAGAAWGSLVGPEGTLIVGLLGAVAGGIGGEKLVTLGLGGQ